MDKTSDESSLAMASMAVQLTQKAAKKTIKKLSNISTYNAMKMSELDHIIFTVVHCEAELLGIRSDTNAR